MGRFGTEDPAHDGLNWYTYCGGNALRRIDPDGENWKDILVGAVVSLDENLTGGFVLWALEQITGKDELALESKYDFYEGKLVGDVISTVVGIKSTVDGVKTIIGSIGGGAAITIGSGGTAAVAGVAVSVGGVAIGTAEIGYGCVVLSKAANNFSDNLRRLRYLEESDLKTIEKILEGLEDITSKKGNSTVYRSSGGYEQAVKDFYSFNLREVKDIKTKYGSGLEGKTEGGLTVVARRGSRSGEPTLEIRFSKKKTYKVRY